MSGITTCPKCHGQLQGSLHVHERTLICPHCNTPIARSDHDLDVPEYANRNLRRGLGLFDWVMLGNVSLMALVILCTCYVLPPARHWMSDRSLLLFVEIAVLDVLVIIACLTPIYRYLDSRKRLAPYWIPGFILFSLSLAIAIVIFFGFVCDNFLLR